MGCLLWFLNRICHCYHSAVCNIEINWTTLYQHLTVFGMSQHDSDQYLSLYSKNTDIQHHNKICKGFFMLTWIISKNAVLTTTFLSTTVCKLKIDTLFMPEGSICHLGSLL